MNARHLETKGGEVKKGAFKICYFCDAGGSPMTAPSCAVWVPNNVAVAITLLTAPSGTGKSSFLHCLHDIIEPVETSLRNLTGTLDFVFSPQVDHNEVAVGIVPQNPPIVRHWRVSDIVPENSPFLNGLFDNGQVSMNELNHRYLSQLSGGQQKKVYTSSVLDNLSQSSADNAFLLLDETFDGLGVSEAKRCMERIAKEWSKLHAARSLNILIVTHLADAEFADINPACTRIRLDLTEETETFTRVKISQSNA